MEYNHITDEGSLQFQTGRWKGMIDLGCGANLLSLQHSKGYDLLRTPACLEEHRKMPEVWGSPLLFPPNRISQARFQFDGRTYALPQNDPIGQNHLHGMLSRRPWDLADFGQDAILLQFDNTPARDCYSWFPHPFQARLSYRFKEDAVWQEIQFRNLGETRMPFGFGFHTAFRMDFATPGKESALRTRVRATTADFEWERDPVFPTGHKLPLLDDWKAGVIAEGRDISVHTPVRTDNNGFRGAILEAPLEGVRINYEVSEQFQHWVLWNFRGTKSMFCPEPQTWVIDAPNLSLPEEESGMRGLAPGEVWTARNRISISTFEPERTTA